MSEFILDVVNDRLRQAYRAAPLPDGPVLEAGGGSFSHFELPDGAPLLALDISHGQLVRNEATPLRLQADLHALPIGERRLGMVVCFNVIEHLDDPESALRQMVDALAPGGLLLLGCPNRNSLKGVITAWTPVWVHRAYYRWIVGKVDRGDGHYDVFPTPFRSVVSDRRLAPFLAERGLELEWVNVYDGAAAFGITTGSWKTRLAAIPYYALARTLKVMTGGRFDGTGSDMLMIARRPSAA